MKFKVGDKVKVRKGLPIFEAISEMKKFEGKTVTITFVGCIGYNILEDDGDYFWDDEMFEDPEEIKKAIQYLWDKNMLTCDEKETLTKRLKEKEEK